MWSVIPNMQTWSLVLVGSQLIHGGTLEAVDNLDLGLYCDIYFDK